MKFLNIKFPNERSPSLIIHIYYLMIAITFTYLYYHKFVQGADFYNPTSPGGIIAVANFESMKPIQLRILIPMIFKALSMLQLVPPKLLFFFINTGLAYLILFSFYFLLGRYFKSKAMNCWLAPIIIYPMIWNLIIMNGQFFYMDFALLLSMIAGFYFIVAKKPNWLLLTFFIGLLNHSGVIYLIMSYLLFNYRELFKIKTIIYSTSMVFYFWLQNGTLFYLFSIKCYKVPQGLFMAVMYTRQKSRGRGRGRNVEARPKQTFSRQGEDEAEAANSRPRQGSKIKSTGLFISLSRNKMC